MTQDSVAPPARTTQGEPPRPPTRDMIAAAVEETLVRLKRARPHLEGRIDRAAGYLVVQLSSASSTRPIRCRVRKNGKRVYLVASMSRPGIVYEVDPSGWACTCRDFFRNGLGCKHSLASYTLTKATVPPPQTSEDAAQGDDEEGVDGPEPNAEKKDCDACQDGWVHLAEQIVDKETGEVLEATNTVRCRRCRERPPEPTLSDEEMRQWMESSRWIWATSYADSHPHWYTLKRHQDPERFDAAARTIWHLGWDRMYLGRPWRSLEIGAYYVWVYTLPKPRMPFPTRTMLVNRAPRAHERWPGRGA